VVVVGVVINLNCREICLCIVSILFCMKCMHSTASARSSLCLTVWQILHNLIYCKGRVVAVSIIGR
jgi:hypothetical protein